MGKFVEGVLRYRLKVEEKSDTGYRDMLTVLYTKIVVRTPFDTGKAQGDWVAHIGPEPQWTETGLFGAPASLASITAELAKVKATDKVWLSNGLPYIQCLEYGLYPNPPKNPTGKTINGFSTQAPAGMVRVTAAEFGAEKF